MCPIQPTVRGSLFKCEHDKRVMLRLVATHLVGGVAAFLVFWLLDMRAPILFTLPAGFVVVGIGVAVVRTRKDGALASLGVALGIVAIAFLVFWFVQIPLRDTVVYTTTIFVVVFSSEFIPRKRDTIGRGLT